MGGNMNWKKQGEQQVFQYPASTYEIKLIKLDRGNAKTGSPQVTWTAEIISGPYTGKRITCWTSLLDTALWRIAKLVAACGIDLSKLPEMAIDSAAFTRTLQRCLGAKMYWLVSEGVSKEGKPRNNVDDFLPHPDQIMAEESRVTTEDGPDFLKE